jgi:competence protein ComEA
MKKLLLPLLLVSMNICAKPVNINTADAATIDDALTGVGKKKAAAIIADRTKNGPFKTVDDLKRVSGIGEKTIAANKADILLTDAKPAAAPASAAKPATAPVAPVSAAPAAKH